jgi:hypothetical protein
VEEGNEMKIRIGNWVAIAITSLVQLLFSPTVLAAPRVPQPPWPQASLNTFGWDSPYSKVPLRKVALNEDAATYQESWSGFALVRDGLTTLSPVIIPATGSETRPNVAVARGAVRFWFAPDWSAATANSGGTGPGHYAQLLELVDVSSKMPVTRWSLYVSPTGNTLYLSGQGASGAVDYLQAPIELRAGEWRMITVCYSPTNTALWLDTEVIATGAGVATPTATEAGLGLVVGSDVYGADPAEGQFDELTTFDYWPKADDQQFYHHGTADNVALGPISAEEEATIAKRRAEWKARKDAEGEGDGMAMMRFASSGASADCLTNGPVYLTNVVCYLTTNEGWTVGFDIAGGTNGVPYDIFATTNLLGNNITNAQWLWEDLGYTCNSYTFTNQPTNQTFFVVGTPLDSDNDGLTDAFEQLVSKSDWHNADTDDDGMPDSWEFLAFTNFNQTAAGDYDGDGWSNVEEMLLGKNPALADPARPVIAISALNASVSEAGSSNATFLITRSGDLNQQTKVSYSIEGTADFGVDYQPLPTFTTFAPGQSNAVVSVHPINDADFEGNETLLLALLPHLGYGIGLSSNATGMIIEDDPPVVNVTAINPKAVENPTVAGLFFISTTIPLDNSLTLSFRLAGTATNGVHYSLIGSNLVIPAGANGSGVLVLPVNNTNYTGPLTVKLTLLTNAAYRIATNAGIAVVTITDDELPTVQIMADDADAREGSTVRDGRFKFIRNASLNEPLEIVFAVHGTANPGADYDTLPTRISIPAGTNAAFLTVHPVDDGESEMRETVIAVLRGSRQYNIGAANVATVFVDDDEPTAYSWELTKATAISESGGTFLVPAEFVIRRTGSTLTDTKHKLLVIPAGGTWESGTDYTWAGDMEIYTPPGSAYYLSEVRAVFADRRSVAKIQVNKNTASGSPYNSTTQMQVYVTNLFGTANSQSIFFHGKDRLISVSFLTTQVTEGATATLRFSRPAQSGQGTPYPAITIPFQLAGAAILGADYSLTPVTNFAVTLAYASNTTDVSLQAINDGITEGWESVYVRLPLTSTTYSPDIRAGQNWGAAINIRDATTPGQASPLDSDGDGMPDDFENATGSNRLVFDDPYQDSDGDGISDLEESLAGMNPHAKDSDGDGLDDYTEWTHGGNPTDAAQNTLLSPDNYVPIRLAVASCYKCHQTTLSAGQYRLTSVPPIAGHTADTTRQEQIFQFVKGVAYPVSISGPATGDPAGRYTAEILAPTNGAPPGFFLDDPDGMLGVSQPVSNLAAKVATVIVPKVTLSLPPTLDVNNNFDEGKTTNGLRVADNGDASPLTTAGQWALTQHAPMQLAVAPNLASLYALTSVTLEKSYEGVATNEDQGDLRVIARDGANHWREISFGSDLGSYLSPQGSNNAYNLFYAEGLAPGRVKLQVKLGAAVTAEQWVEICTHKTKADWQAEVRNEVFFDSGGTVSIETYAASAGFMNNRSNLFAVYRFYEKLFTERPTQFYWAGLAKLAGAPVYAGLSDAEHFKNGFYLGGIVPGLIGRAADESFQQTLIAMNIAIFNDLAWQFEAYRMGGVCALERVKSVSPDDVDIAPWRIIDQGIRESDPMLIRIGNLQLLQREQRDILKPGYKELRSLPGAAQLMSTLAKNPVPQGPDFQSVVSDGNLADYWERWQWITQPNQGMWTLWLAMPQSNQLQNVSIFLRARAADFSIVPLPIK